jgi:hypothetical protein
LVELDNRLRWENRRLGLVAPGGTAAAVLMNLDGVQDRLATYETREAAIEGVSWSGITSGDPYAAAGLARSRHPQVSNHGMPNTMHAARALQDIVNTVAITAIQARDHEGASLATATDSRQS